MYKFLLGMLTMATLGAFLTKPGPEAAETELKAQLLQALAGQDLKGKNGVEAAALLACRLDPDSCYDLVRSGVEVVFEDKVLYAQLGLDGFGHKATCYGVFTRFFCPGGLQPE